MSKIIVEPRGYHSCTCEINGVIGLNFCLYIVYRTVAHDFV